MARGQLDTYSGVDVNVTIQWPGLDAIQAGGISETGLVQVVVRMTTVRTDMKVGMDASVNVSAIPGDNGEVELQVWQNSTLTQALNSIYNSLLAAMGQGDVSNWASGTVMIQAIVGGSQHVATGCAFQKRPDTSYQQQAQPQNWILMAANIANN